MGGGPDVEFPRFAVFEFVTFAPSLADVIAAGLSPEDPNDNGGADANDGAAVVVVAILASEDFSGALPRFANMLLLLDEAGAGAGAEAALLF